MTNFPWRFEYQNAFPECPPGRIAPRHDDLLIATQQGNPCLPGRLITNAQDYLMDRMFASGVAAAADGFADTQTTTQRATDGTLTQFFSGDSGEYVAGRTLSGSLTELTEPLEAAGIDVHVIGGAHLAAELDAKRAIDQGSRLAARL